MKKFNNSKISYIDGYLGALTDMDKNQGENVTRAFLKTSNETKLLDYLQESFPHLKSLWTIKEQLYTNSKGLYHLLDKMLFLNPCACCKGIEQKEKENYRKYILSHINDYIDFVFEDMRYDYPEKISISLIGSEQESFIVLTINRKDIDLLLVFFQNNLNGENFLRWFNELVKCYKNNIKEYSSKQLENDNDTFANGLTLSENKQIIEPIIKNAIKLGYIDENSKNIILKYFSKEKIVELEKALFDT